jgi:hypothetical protein
VPIADMAVRARYLVEGAQITSVRQVQYRASAAAKTWKKCNLGIKPLPRDEQGTAR